ncbi:hypothetical protein KR074_005621, partial [Drosophila pseudoananassae]
MEMIVSEWKRLNFFDEIELSSVKFPTDTDIACYCCNVIKQNEESKVIVVFCGKSGSTFISSNFDLIEFKGKHSQNAASFCALTSSNLLAIVTEDTNLGLYIDIYDLRRLTKSHGAPLFASAYVDVTSKASCINLETIGDDFLALGLGLENGDILLHYGKIIPSMCLNIQKYSISKNLINGMYFDFSTHGSNTQSCNMYASCSKGVISLLLKDNSEIVTKFRNDNDEGHHNDFCTIRKSENGKIEESMFIVGRDDAVYCYTRDGRGPCFAIEGRKKFISWVGQYLFVAINSTQFPNRNQITSLIVVDTCNKIVVFVKQVENFVCAISGFEFLYITKSEDKNEMILNKLKQYDTSKKIRLLIEKNMYEIALRSLNYDDYAYSFDAAYIRFLYGNYLLFKGDVESAVIEYVKTIGIIKPFSVISKLLYMRYNENLKYYLTAVEKVEPSNNIRQLIEFCINRRHLSNEIDQIKLLFESLHGKPFQGFEKIFDLSKMYFNLSNQNKIKYGSEDCKNPYFKCQVFKGSPNSFENSTSEVVSNIIEKRSSELTTDLNKSFLITFKNACTNGSNLVLKIKPIVTEKVVRAEVDSKNEKGEIKYLNTKIKCIRYNLLSFTLNPIEFRNDTCDICGEILGSQTVYFLCQHSFHKGCLSHRTSKYKDSICVTCTEEKYSLPDDKNSEKYDSDSFDIVLLISKLFSLGIK